MSSGFLPRVIPPLKILCGILLLGPKWKYSRLIYGDDPGPKKDAAKAILKTLFTEEEYNDGAVAMRKRARTHAVVKYVTYEEVMYHGYTVSRKVSSGKKAKTINSARFGLQKK